MKRLVTLSTLMVLVFCSACENFDWHAFVTKKKSGEKAWSENAQSPPATVPWKGQALAADTFIRISKMADEGVVNIGTTRVIKERRGHPFFFGPESRSPFEEFFGDEMFRQFFGEPFRNDTVERKQSALGSGFVLNEEGFIVTNNHVVAKADEITVTIGKDREYKAKLVGADPKTDVALVKIAPKEKLKSLTLGDSDQLQVGEIVIAIGNPFGLSHTMTQGIVSAKERAIGFGPYDNFIQTDAAINFGNSGGPLLNLKAEVVGINAAIVAASSGIGFAIPVNLAKNVIAQLKEKGSVTRGWLGVLIQKVDPDVAKSFGLKERRGALVSSVQKGSPAEKVGIKSGDVITKVNGKEIVDYGELPRIIAEIPVGKKTTIELLRNGKVMTVTPVIGELKAEKGAAGEETEEEGPSKPAKPDRLGLSVTPLTERLAQQFDLESGTEGVVVQSIDPNGPAYEKGVRTGDLILEINRRKVASLEDYRKISKSLSKGDTVLLLLKRQGGVTLFVAFTL